MLHNDYILVENKEQSSYVERNSEGDYFIHNSKFNNLSNHAILVVQQSSFIKCSFSSYQGGSIYFGTKGECALSKVCATESKNQGLSNGGIFSYQYVSQEDSAINSIDLSTIFNYGIHGTGNNVIGFVNGNITLSNTNESQNLAVVDPFFQIDNATSSHIKYCEFENSTTTKHTMVYQLCTITLNSCNIVKCKLSNIEGVLVIVQTSVILTNCAILQHQSSAYFCIDSISTATLIKCAVDCDSSGFTVLGNSQNNYNTVQIGKSSFINNPSLLEYKVCLGDDFYQSQTKICITDKFINFNKPYLSFIFVLIAISV